MSTFSITLLVRKKTLYADWLELLISEDAVFDYE